MRDPRVLRALAERMADDLGRLHSLIKPEQESYADFLLERIGNAAENLYWQASWTAADYVAEGLTPEEALVIVDQEAGSFHRRLKRREAQP